MSQVQISLVFLEGDNHILSSSFVSQTQYEALAGPSFHKMIQKKGGERILGSEG
jgi:hypothetical protein